MAICGSVNTADGHEAVIGGDHRAVSSQSTQQVVPHHARLVVGDVLELIGRRHVAEREDATRGGALVLVDHDLAVVVDLDAGQLGVEQVAVGIRPVATSSSVGVERRAVVEFEHDAGRRPWCAPMTLLVGAQVPLLRRRCR